MPRRQFIADLQKAQSDVELQGVRDIKAGDDDGQFQFEVSVPALDGAPPVAVNITAMIPDLSDYPKDHQYMIFCGEDAPRHIAQAMQNIRGTDRKSVFELIDMVSACITSLVSDVDGDTTMRDSQLDNDDEQYDEDSDADDVYADDDDAFDFGGPAPHVEFARQQATTKPNSSWKGDKASRDRVRSDLRAAKDAGFKIGHLGSLLEGNSSFVTVSIRMSKLGISEEAMQAWKVEPSDYFILLIQYPNGYKTNEELQDYDSLRLKPNLGMRVYASKKYKPTLQEAIKAFTRVRTDHAGSTGSAKDTESSIVASNSIHEIFISRPLATLLEDNLVPILRFRSQGMDWAGAEAWFNDIQCAGATKIHDAVPDKYYEPEIIHKALPSIMHGDQYRQRDVIKYSFHLLAMQFAVRHFARCTEFCMVCHTKLDGELEAIKPYVCENPLCLFQYMSLGFGPSIEHEIMTQPYVVDLLISFCYSSAKTEKLKEYPDGLGLMVPPVFADPNQAAHDRYGDYMSRKTQPQHTTSEMPHIQKYEIDFDRERREIMFKNKVDGGCPVSRGQWIVIECPRATLNDPDDELHCRVSETNFYPTITVEEPISVHLPPSEPLNQYAAPLPPTQPPIAEKTVTPALTPRWVSASFTIYNQEFEPLLNTHKCVAMCKLLDTLPTVKEMQRYLSSHHGNDLKRWTDRMSPAATSLLRWIIASNRACIMQVESGAGEKSNGAKGHKEERLHGMEGYMQFRFAMGAPDKEARFTSEVRKTTERLSLNYPTIFAWHGSPLHNWHMIIREGLHFKNVDHGRAYGNGVYHAKHAGTSTGYSGMGYGSSQQVWPKSILRVSTALALNEIVNSPTEFVSQNPFFVVSQLDWIQTRYLFVKCSPTDENIKPGEEAMPASVHPQDPLNTPKGPDRLAITIPASAIKSGRLEKKLSTADKRSSSGFGGTTKKLKDRSGSYVATAIDLDDDTASVYTDAEDLEILFDEEEPAKTTILSTREQTHAGVGTQKMPTGATAEGKGKVKSCTDFLPGSLDFDTLPLMPTPTYATPATTKRLQTELMTLSKIQSSTDAVELGWYIDFEKIENMYQWIVELHSFHTFTVKDKPLPLADDMKKTGTTSIVLEIRFGPDFPFSPPYIRVIRPRFLPFTMGGGGHVVIGGAMCMELLTNTGWSGIMSMESVLMQVRMAIASEPFARLEGKGAKLPAGRVHDYGVGEAAEGYIRACASHGWAVPKGFREVALGVADEAIAGASFV
ncbi:hypothetical protein Q7P37_006013 [Cladosporium fusiforme]